MIAGRNSKTAGSASIPKLLSSENYFLCSPTIKSFFTL